MKKLLVAVLLLFVTSAFAQNITVTVVGEAQIIKGDLASAKIEAESRAKWAAMEEAAQVQVKVGSIIHNSQLLDESVKSEVSASIANFKKIDEGKDGDTYWIKAKVTVKPDKANDAMGNYAKNTTIAVYMPLIMQNGEVEESHPFSEKLINDLINKGFDVIDIASEMPENAVSELSKAAAKNNFSKVREITSKYMAGSLLIGKIKVIDKGKNVGYANINFSIANGELDYRLVGNKDGKKSVLASGTLSNRGQASTDVAAAYNVSINFSKRESNQLANIVSTKLLGTNKKSVHVVLFGNNNRKKLEDFRDMLKNISWVLNVKEQGLDKIDLEYPEKTLYLATIIEKNGYKVKSFSDYEIIVYPR